VKVFSKKCLQFGNDKPPEVTGSEVETIVGQNEMKVARGEIWECRRKSASYAQLHSNAR
jgi:hypothetical protein